MSSLERGTSRFPVHEVSGGTRFTEATSLPESRFGKAVAQSFQDVGFFLGTTAVHGLEPQQIAGNVASAMNEILETNGVPRKPIILPYVPGHPIYGERNRRVLQEVFTGERAKEVFLSKDLGRALIQTEFTLAGYQRHWDNVRRFQPNVQSTLDTLMNSDFRAERLDGQEVRIFNQQNPDSGERPRVIEINAGANASAATSDGRIVSHSVFPNTLDGLAELVDRNPDTFGYQQDLVTDIKQIGYRLRTKFDVIILPDIHPLAHQPWFEEKFSDAIMTPPLKDPLQPPEVSFTQMDSEEDQELFVISIIEEDGRLSQAPNYDPKKGIVYMNVSGGGMGAEEAKGFAILAQEEGYVIAAPPWLKNQWVKESSGDLQLQFENVLSALPNLLFAADQEGNPLCVAQMLRPGLGAISNSQIAGQQGEGIPMIVLPGSKLENPETRSNGDVLVREGLGVEYTGQPDISQMARALKGDVRRQFYKKVYTQYGIPPEMRGLAFVGEVLVRAEIERTLACQ